MAAEDDEEQEGVLALPATEETVPASPRKNEGDAGDGGTEDDRSGGRTAEEIAQERPRPVVRKAGGSGTEDRSGGQTAKKREAVVSGGLRSERSESGEALRGRTAFARSESLGRVANRRNVITGEIMPEAPGPIAGELWKGGPVWTVQSVRPEAGEAQRTEAAERTAQAEEAFQPSQDGPAIWTGLERTARGGTSDPALEGTGRSGLARAGLEQTGLKGLYRQTVRGLLPAAPALPPEQTGRNTRAQEPGSAASLALDELDRAVRRDSRRYDGGMSIF